MMVKLRQGEVKSRVKSMGLWLRSLEWHFLVLNVSWCPGEVEGKGLGSGFLQQSQEQAHSLCSSHAPAPAGIFGWVSRCWGWCVENRLGSLSSFGLNLPSSPGLELNFPCNAGKCQCWGGSWQSNLLTELSLHHRGSPKSPWYPNTAQELCWLSHKFGQCLQADKDKVRSVCLGLTPHEIKCNS